MEKIRLIDIINNSFMEIPYWKRYINLDEDVLKDKIESKYNFDSDYVLRGIVLLKMELIFTDNPKAYFFKTNNIADIFKTHIENNRSKIKKSASYLNEEIDLDNYINFTMVEFSFLKKCINHYKETFI